MKMEFFIHIYFFIFAIHPQLGRKRNIDASAKQYFVNYLETRGQALAKSP